MNEDVSNDVLIGLYLDLGQDADHLATQLGRPPRADELSAARTLGRDGSHFGAPSTRSRSFLAGEFDRINRLFIRRGRTWVREVWSGKPGPSADPSLRIALVPLRDNRLHYAVGDSHPLTELEGRLWLVFDVSDVTRAIQRADAVYQHCSLVRTDSSVYGTALNWNDVLSSWIVRDLGNVLVLQ